MKDEVLKNYDGASYIRSYLIFMSFIPTTYINSIVIFVPFN